MQVGRPEAHRHQVTAWLVDRTQILSRQACPRAPGFGHRVGQRSRPAAAALGWRTCPGATRHAELTLGQLVFEGLQGLGRWVCKQKAPRM